MCVAVCRDNLEWLARATNWAKFTATASLGVIHKVCDCRSSNSGSGGGDGDSSSSICSSSSNILLSVIAFCHFVYHLPCSLFLFYCVLPCSLFCMNFTDSVFFVSILYSLCLSAYHLGMRCVSVSF